jgi:hypothetical protein
MFEAAASHAKSGQGICFCRTNKYGPVKLLSVVGYAISAPVLTFALLLEMCVLFNSKNNLQG